MKNYREFITKNIGYAAVALVCLVWMCMSFVAMGKTGKSVHEIISDSSLSLCMGVSINYLLGIQGSMNGERDERMISTRALHGATVERISPYIERLDGWCANKNAEALKTERTKLLAAAGLKYSDCFDSDGVAQPYTPNTVRLKNKLQRADELRRIKIYRRAVKLRLSLLSSSELTGEGGRSGDPNYLGPTKAQYQMRSGIQDIASKIAMSLVFGYYAVDLVKEFNYASLIWRGLQVCIFLVMGIIKMYNFYNFTVEDYRGRIIKKIDNLQKFENDIKNGSLKNGST